jgi:hypothetical protein
MVLVACKDGLLVTVRWQLFWCRIQSTEKFASGLNQTEKGELLREMFHTVRREWGPERKTRGGHCLGTFSR